jgi:hypothetical protein
VCLGEGLCGDYNPDDPDDRPVLRADLHIPDNADGLSYATLATTAISEERLREISRDLFNALPADPHAGGIRGVMERWTRRTSDTPRSSPMSDFHADPAEGFSIQEMYQMLHLLKKLQHCLGYVPAPFFRYAEDGTKDYLEFATGGPD